MAVLNAFNAINITGMTTATGVFIGNNNQQGWDTNGKLVMGVGQVQGIAQLAFTGPYLYVDNDVIDDPVVENQIKNSNTLQGM